MFWGNVWAAVAAAAMCCNVVLLCCKQMKEVWLVEVRLEAVGLSFHFDRRRTRYATLPGNLVVQNGCPPNKTNAAIIRQQLSCSPIRCGLIHQIVWAM
jgi:hypothetical protein